MFNLGCITVRVDTAIVKLNCCDLGVWSYEVHFIAPYSHVVCEGQKYRAMCSKKYYYYWHF